MTANCPRWGCDWSSQSSSTQKFNQAECLVDGSRSANHEDTVQDCWFLIGLDARWQSLIHRQLANWSAQLTVVQPWVLWGSSRLYAVCCRLSRVILSVCWLVQLSGFAAVSYYKSPDPLPLFIAVSKSPISMVTGAEMTDTPECLPAGSPFNARLH